MITKMALIVSAEIDEVHVHTMEELQNG